MISYREDDNFLSEFTKFGLIFDLWSKNKIRSNIPLLLFRKLIRHAVQLDQIEILLDEKGYPIAYACWAYVTDIVLEELNDNENRALLLNEWNEGNNLYIIDIMCTNNSTYTFCKNYLIKRLHKFGKFNAIRRYNNKINRHISLSLRYYEK